MGDSTVAYWSHALEGHSIHAHGRRGRLATDASADQATAFLECDRFASTLPLPLPHFRQRNRSTNWAMEVGVLEPEPHQVMLRDEAAVLTAQAAHHNNRARTLHHIAHYRSIRSLIRWIQWSY